MQIKSNTKGDFMTLLNIKAGQKAYINNLNTDDKIKKYLTSLGCAEGEAITLVSILGDKYIINVKDCRYVIDTRIASVIKISI